MNLAPNGKPSNLNPEQYRLVRTPAFKKWFGDWENDAENSSKVIDENGEPLVVYHGSNKKFYVFDPSKEGSNKKTIRMGGNAIYFSNKERVSRMFTDNYGFGYIYPCFLVFKNPVFLNGKEEEIRFLNEELKKISTKKDIIVKNTLDILGMYKGQYQKNYISDIYITSNPKNIKLADKIYKPIWTEKGMSKLKTIGKINTTFDANNPDIRFGDGGEIESLNDGHNRKILKYFDVDDGEELGHLIYYYDTKNSFTDYPNFNNGLYIEFIEVNRQHRGKGIGKKLIRRAINDAKELGIEVVTLKRDYGYDYDMTDDYLKKYYSSLGFVQSFSKKDVEEGKDINEMYLDIKRYANNPDIRFKTGGSIRKPKKRTISQTPAPKKDRIYGSKINKPKSSESKSKASSIILSPSVIKSIRTKINQHNEEYPNKKIPLSSAKAVVRRGMGAYSSTHRPTISGGKPNSRVAWGLARLNAFIYKIVKGKSKSGKYKQDDDLINELGYRVKPYAYGGQITDEQKETYKKWKELVNMSRSELEKFYNSQEGKVAGLSSSEAKKAGIDSGRESARWIMKMKYVPVKEWNSNMWRWAKKQISFISRMSGVKGKLYDEKGRKTRKHLALLIWGHNPEKQ